MTSLQRIISCAIAGVLWLAAIIAKHFWPDIEIGAFVMACGTTIAALGVHGATVGTSPSAQGGFASARLLAVIAAVALGLSMLGGCASLMDAGHSSYSVTSVKDKDGNVAGCDLNVNDGKEFANRKFQFQSMGPVCGLTVEEGDSKAFKGQALAVKGLTILPSLGLQDILAPRDK